MKNDAIAVGRTKIITEGRMTEREVNWSGMTERGMTERGLAE